MLLRKIEKKFEDWKNTINHKPLIVRGVRQCGKTYSVLDFANKNYENVVYINFFQNEKFLHVFDKSLEVDDIILNIKISTKEPVKFVANRTVIIFDEIQFCPKARTALKFFYLDGRYDVIATGSLLGVSGYGDKELSIPVGYETFINMYPLDFEEFLWSQNIDDDVILKVKKCLNDIEPVPYVIHNKLKELLLMYIVLGGMPSVIENYNSGKDLDSAVDEQRNIIYSYKDDMVKYAIGSDKNKIRECFDTIPYQLAKDNKKFQYSFIRKKATSSGYISSIKWIEDAGMVKRCYNLAIPELPLRGNIIIDQFKIYMSDIGLLVASFERGIERDILKGNIGIYKGAIYENLIADFFIKSERDLYYFMRSSGLEIDFVTKYNDELTLVEVKATTGNAKSLRTVLNDKEHYDVNRAIKFGDYNVGYNGKILTLPLYMGAFI